MLYLLHLAKLSDGACLTMDNLYPSTQFCSLLERGVTIIITHWDGRTEESKIESIHSLGTMRSNRMGGGKEFLKSITWTALTKDADIAAWKEKPLLDKVRAYVTDDDAKVMVLSIYDKKPFFMITTQHYDIRVTTKQVPWWNPETREIEQREKEVLVIVDDYNHRMGFVDDSDLLAWAYQIGGHAWREKKYTNSLFYWALRKRPDQALCAYMIKWKSICRGLEKTRDNTSLGADIRAHAAEELKLVIKKRPDHYAWLEDITQWMVVVGYNKDLPPAKTLALKASSAYDAIKAGPIRVIGGQSDKSSRKRAMPHTGDDLPASRLEGKHRIGQHVDGAYHTCDMPGCLLRRLPTQDKRPKSGPGSRGGKAKGQTSGRSSPVLQSEGKSGRTKLFCKDCFDKKGVRPMNFHPTCWNVWHFGQECEDP